ncbi:MAG: hydrogenase maturation protease [Candidatus Limnocylindrales bacterium]
MTTLDGPAVVLGVGNILLRDDGVGVRVVEGLRSLVEHDPSALPEGTRLVDGGTLGLDLLQTVDGARCLLLLDAVDLGQPAGTLSVLRGDAVLAAGGAWGGSVPGGVGELLAAARLMGWLPDTVAMVGIQVRDTGFGVGLSEHVAAALPPAIATARQELHELHKLAHAATSRAAGAGEAEGAMA